MDKNEEFIRILKILLTLTDMAVNGNRSAEAELKGIIQDEINKYEQEIKDFEKYIENEITQKEEEKAGI